MGIMYDLLNQMLSCISILQQVPQSKNNKMGSISKSGGVKVYFILNYPTTTCSRRIIIMMIGLNIK